MIWHPLTIAMLFAEAVSIVIFLSAATRLWVIVPVRPSGGNDAGQAARERSLEVAGFQGAWALLIQIMGFVLLVAGMSNVWPAYVPGAMCGMGVVQALGVPAVPILVFKLMGLLLLCGWYAVQKIEGQVPESTAWDFQGRLFLSAAPFLILADWWLVRGLAGMNVDQPVGCCAAVFDMAAGNGGALLELKISSGGWTWLGSAAVAAAIGWGWQLARRPVQMIRKSLFAPVLAIGAALPVTYMVLTRVTAPYVLQVLHHPCAWCLFLREHGAPGVVLFGLPAWLAAETAAVVGSVVAARRHPALEQPAAGHISRAGHRIIAAALLTAAAAAAPALWWYSRFGDWMR